MPKKSAARTRPDNRPSKEQLEALVEEATVDCHDEEEQRMGFLTMIQDNLEVPFETEVLGVPVTVESIDANQSEDVVAICKRGDKRQSIPILDLPLPDPQPQGAEWIWAYRYWLGER